jgi:hypothetical protein
MNQYEIYYRVINKLLNGAMKKKYDYHGLVFYINPIQYITNREFSSVFGVKEIVSINLKKTINMYQKDKLILDLKNCLNSITPYVEGGDYRRISKVEIKINQRICSGIVQKFPNPELQNHD